METETGNEFLAMAEDVLSNMDSCHFCSCFEEDDGRRYDDGVEEFIRRLKVKMFPPPPPPPLFNGHIEKYIVIAENEYCIPTGTICYEEPIVNHGMGRVVSAERFGSFPLLEGQDIVSCFEKHGIKIRNLSKTIKEEIAAAKGKPLENAYVPFRKQERNSYPLIIQRDEFGMITRFDNGLQDGV